MIRTTISLPELGLIAGTRGMAGAGIGLLIADRIAPAQRRAIGWTLLAVGLLTTIPLAAQVFLSRETDCDKDRKRQLTAKPEEAHAGAM